MHCQRCLRLSGLLLEKKNNMLRFVIRQVYRVSVVWPWIIGVSFVSKFFPPRMLGPTTDKPCVVITSVAAPSDKKVSYSETRSVYTVEQRVAQTKKTIASVRTHIPNAHICLIEGGNIHGEEEALSSLVDTWIDLRSQAWVRRAVNSKLKSIGEAVMLLGAWKQLPRAPYYWKMSARYTITEEFTVDTWSTSAMTRLLLRDEYMSTRLYGVDGTIVTLWWRSLAAGLALGLLDYPIEHTLERYTPAAAKKSIARLGIAGADAVNGNAIRE